MLLTYKQYMEQARLRNVQFGKIKQARRVPQACKVLQQFCHIQWQMDDSVFDHDILGIKNIRVANDR